MPPNVENIHHVIVHTCNPNYKGDPEIKPAACFGDKGPTQKDIYCSTISLA